MKKLLIAKKVFTFLTCSVLSAGLITFYPEITGESREADAAKTIAEIQDERKQNEAKISEYEEQINALEGDKSNEQAYQAALSEQIALIQENIFLLNTELDQLSEDIALTEENIIALDRSIVEQQQQIDDNIELFKQRLCAMYVSGNENLASVVLGSSSFYDIMSRVEMVNRIASYDEELIDNILEEIDNLEKSKKDLESEKLNLEMKQEEQQKKKAEKSDEIVQLGEKMQYTQEMIDKIQLEQNRLTADKADTEKAIAALDAEEEKIREEIRKAEEEAKRKAEEEAKKKAAEEAARKKAEEEAAKKAAEEAARKKAEEEAKKKAAEEAARKKAEEEAAKKAAEEEAAKKAAEEAARKKAEEEEAARQAEIARQQQQQQQTTAAQTQTTTVQTTTAAPVTTTTVTTTTYTPTVSASGFAWPIPGFYYISSYYGARWGTTHKGIDVGDAGIMGGTICASKSGTVTYVNNSCTHNYAKTSSCGCGGGYGNYVIITHDGTYSTLYGHMSYATVSVGDYVEQGQAIGVVGSTGWSTGAHLHFEVRVNGIAQDPLGYVSP